MDILIGLLGVPLAGVLAIVCTVIMDRLLLRPVLEELNKACLHRWGHELESLGRALDPDNGELRSDQTAKRVHRIWKEQSSSKFAAQYCAFICFAILIYDHLPMGFDALWSPTFGHWIVWAGIAFCGIGSLYSAVTEYNKLAHFIYQSRQP